MDTDDRTNTIKFKVGKAVDVEKRTRQWEKQCAPLIQALRGFHPGSLEQGGGLWEGQISINPGDKIPFYSRVGELKRFYSLVTLPI